MSKMKTHRGAAKRFKVSGTKKLLRGRANLSHILEKKSPRRKRRLTGTAQVSAADSRTVRRQLGI